MTDRVGCVEYYPGFGYRKPFKKIRIESFDLCLRLYFFAWHYHMHIVLSLVNIYHVVSGVYPVKQDNWHVVEPFHVES